MAGDVNLLHRHRKVERGQLEDGNEAIWEISVNTVSNADANGRSARAAAGLAYYCSLEFWKSLMDHLQPGSQSVDLNTGQPEAVLRILAKRASGAAASDAEWNALLGCEGYQRLKRREEEMGEFGSPFADSQFREFVLSEELARQRVRLQAALEQLKAADLEVPIQRALAYLPKRATVRAIIYVVIKPRSNSFVHDVERDPALFVAVDANRTPGQLLNVISHELHHIGYAQTCSEFLYNQLMPRLDNRLQQAIEWLTPFGEGIAMLAAAEGAEHHPHQFSEAKRRSRWDADLTHFNRDLQRLEHFYLDILTGKLAGDEEIRRRGMKFFGPQQGAWYSVGWTMGAQVERTFGREVLTRSLCDPRALLHEYNRAVFSSGDMALGRLATWSSSLLDQLGEPAL